MYGFDPRNDMYLDSRKRSASSYQFDHNSHNLLGVFLIFQTAYNYMQKLYVKFYTIIQSDRYLKVI